jgi:hypothetical protein
MSKSIILQINLRKWFPPDDQFAAHVARLCILREDFALEMAGIHDDEIASLDGNQVIWRKMYFWRNLVRTLYEIRNTLRRIEAIDEFRQIFNSQSSEWRSGFKLAVKKLEEDKDLIDDTRNTVGGHVQQATVKQALKILPGDLSGDIEIGEIAGKTHYKFVGEFVVKMIVANVPESEQWADMVAQLETIASHLPVFKLIDDIFDIYVGVRGLSQETLGLNVSSTSISVPSTARRGGR